MNRLSLNKPAFIMVYGYPGSGKTYFARQLSELLGAAHVQGDRIRYELFEEPRFDKQENQIVHHLMQYMSEEFLSAGISVVYDINSMRQSERRELRDLARQAKAVPMLIWLQIDLESAFVRAMKRDRRKSDDKYAMPIDRGVFESIVGGMQNPTQVEDYTVISGKHTFQTQKSAVVKKLYDLGLVTADSASHQVVKPGLVNLVPQGRVDTTRRNIVIR